MRGAAHRRLGDRGSVTVEFALGLPSLVLVLALALSAIAWMLDVQAAQRGASEAARAAIVEPDASATSVGKRVSGQSRVTIDRAGSYITACVSGQRAPWPHYERCATARALP
jgi:Flp pilus assembly protein TadG